HVIAAGSCIVRHGNDDGLFLFQLVHGAPHVVGSDDFAAGRIDANDDAFDGRVGANAGEHAIEGSGFDAVRVAGIFRAAGDVAFADDEGDAVAAGGDAGIGNGGVVVFRDTFEFGLLEGGLELAEHLIFVANVIDETFILRLGGEEGAVVNDGADGAFIFVAAAGDGGDEVAVDVVGEA